MTDFWLCFVPLFVAVDALGVLPVFMGLTDGIERSRIKSIIWSSVLTAAIVGLTFLVIGKAIFNFLGITIADFMIAGGVLLFAFSLRDILAFEKRSFTADPESVGAVPIGVPLIVGPAVLTTSILLLDQFGAVLTGTAMIINIVIAGVVFMLSGRIHRILGLAGTRTISKIASLVLATIGVMMVRKGLMKFIDAGFMQ